MVQITGDGIEDSPAIVQSVSEQTGLATVELCPPGSTDHPRYSETVQVPLSRLKPPRNEVRDCVLWCQLAICHGNV